MTTTVCGTCGRSLGPDEVLYDEQGSVTCQACLLTAQAGVAKAGAARKVLGIAYGGPVLGLLAFVFNPLLLFSIAAVANGLYVLRVVKQPDTAQQLAHGRERAKVAALAGIALGAVAGLLHVIALVT